MAITQVTGSMVATNAISGTIIADNAITAVHIATNAVSGTLIADNAITAVHIAQNSITVTQLADDAVEADKIADGVITTNHLNSAMISSQSEVTANSSDYVLIGDASNSNALKKALVSDFGNTTEQVQDIAGGMFSSNTETGITATYQDGDGTIDLVVGTLNQDTSGTAAIATTVTTADESSDTTCFPLFVTAATGNLAPKSGSNLAFTSSSGALTATSFAGALTGNVTGNASGTALTVTQAAQSAITSVGTLTTLTVDNVIINGTTIGHTSDTDLLTLASGALTVTGTGTVTKSSSTAYDATDSNAPNFSIINPNGSDGSGVNNFSQLEFEVADGATSRATISFVRTADNAGVLAFGMRHTSSGATEKMRIQSDGKVGIGVTDPDCELEVSGTGAMSVPSGTTAQRPTARNGMLRYNTTKDGMEMYVDGSWAVIGLAEIGSEGNPATAASELYAASKADGAYYVTYGGNTFQTYYIGSVFSQGWLLAAVWTNAEGDTEDWFDGDTSLSGSATGTNWYTASDSNNLNLSDMASLTKDNQRGYLFHKASQKMMFRQDYNNTVGYRSHTLNATNSLYTWFTSISQHDTYTNRVTATSTAGSGVTTDGQTMLRLGTIDFNFSLGPLAPGDGARLCTSGPIVSPAVEASGGLGARVDGGRAYDWRGNVVSDKTTRSYSTEGSITNHTIWVFVQ